jgi:replicative DNA helicase
MDETTRDTVAANVTPNGAEEEYIAQLNTVKADVSTEYSADYLDRLFSPDSPVIATTNEHNPVKHITEADKILDAIKDHTPKETVTLANAAEKKLIGATLVNESKYVFVKKEPGTWGIHEHFRQYNNIQADGGWWFELKDEKNIAEICKRSSVLTYQLKPLPIPLPFDEYRRFSTLEYHEDKRIEIEEKARKLLMVAEYEPLTEYHWTQLSAMPEGKKITEAHKHTMKRLQEIKNQEKIASMKPASDSDATDTNLNQDEQEFKELLDPDSEDKIISELTSVSVGIETGYTIGEVNLAFPGGAISIIAAPTSHGKTTALMNFTMGVLEKNTNKSVYFFTHEESRASILISFLSIYIGEEISKNNRGSIEHFFRSTEDRYKYITQSVRDSFITKKESFFRNLIDTRRLKVHYSELTADKLVAAIQFIKSNDPNVGLICVDYMQLLKLATPGRSARQEELKQICLLLNDCAVKTGLPIVLAAQFNRQVVAEEDMSPVAIGEAGDIERIASLIIGIFNRSFDAMTKNGNKSKDGKLIARESTLYVEVLKGRKIGNNHRCVMNFNGNIGVISNIKSSEPNPVLEGFKNMLNKEKGAATKPQVAQGSTTKIDNQLNTQENTTQSSFLAATANSARNKGPGARNNG